MGGKVRAGETEIYGETRDIKWVSALSVPASLSLACFSLPCLRLSPSPPFRAVTGSSARFPKEKGEEIPRRHGSPLSREAAGWD
jgi:hypothetical protein